MFILPPILRSKCVVVLNEYYGLKRTSPGHMNISFYNHGRLEGTFGQNQDGFDTLGHHHASSRVPWIWGPGGVFVEGNNRSQPHYYIVSERNYIHMLNYARARADVTTRTHTRYWLFGQNCADFIRDVFAVTDLPQPVRNVTAALPDRTELVAIYSGLAWSFVTLRDYSLPAVDRAYDPTNSVHSRMAAAR